MSRLNDIRTAVGVHVSAEFTAQGETVTLSADPNAFVNIPRDQYPHARIIFVEEEPERLPFKQERRRVVGEIALAMIDTTREAMDLRIQGIRDRIFGDETLSDSVDDITAEAGITISNPDDHITYGTLDVTTEEIY